MGGDRRERHGRGAIEHAASLRNERQIDAPRLLRPQGAEVPHEFAGLVDGGGLARLANDALAEAMANDEILQGAGRGIAHNDLISHRLIDANIGGADPFDGNRRELFAGRNVQR
jgi:hypothetical protein